MLSLDIAKCKYNHASGPQGVIWETYKSDDLSARKLDGKNSLACYAGFFRKGTINIHNIISAQVEAPTANPTFLTKEEAEAWIDLCIENGLLPFYIKGNTEVEVIKKKNVYGEPVDFVIARMALKYKGWYQILIYTYLNALRHIREHPGHVKAVLYMCNEKGVDFFIAYVLSSQFNIGGVGHHMISVTNNIYGGWNGSPPKDLKNDKFNLKAVRALYRLIHDHSVDRGKVICHGANDWRCYSLIETLASKDLYVPVKYLNDYRVIEIAHELDQIEAVELHRKFVEEIEKEK